MLRFSHCWQLVLGIFVLPLSTTLWGQVSVPAKQASTPTSSIPPVAMGQQHLQLMQLLEQIPPYRPTKSIKGKADLSGSTTMYDLGHQWAMNFKQFHPEVEFAGTAEGSEAAIKMLANDPTIIAGVSRQVDLEDQKLLQAGRCKDPMAIVVATDALVL